MEKDIFTMMPSKMVKTAKKIKVARGTKKFNLVVVEKSFVLNTSKVQ
jgi:hypothetical protein